MPDVPRLADWQVPADSSVLLSEMRRPVCPNFDETFLAACHSGGRLPMEEFSSLPVHVLLDGVRGSVLTRVDRALVLASDVSVGPLRFPRNGVVIDPGPYEYFVIHDIARYSGSAGDAVFVLARPFMRGGLRRSTPFDPMSLSALSSHPQWFSRARDLVR